jgi:hypothetical protein
VELFFKWIKRFFGTSENAVKTQIWIAVSVYVLVAIVKKRLNLDASLYTLLQIALRPGRLVQERPNLAEWKNKTNGDKKGPVAMTGLPHRHRV